jgi:hypothetical protein
METLPNLTETDTKQSLPTTSIYTPPILVSEADHVDARIGEFFQAVVPEWPYSSTTSSSSSSFPVSSTQMCDEKSTEEAISTANWCLHKRRHRLIRQTDDELFSSFSSTISSSSSSSLVTAPIETLSVQDRLLSEVSK